MAFRQGVEVGPEVILTRNLLRGILREVISLHTEQELVGRLDSESRCFSAAEAPEPSILLYRQPQTARIYEKSGNYLALVWCSAPMPEKEPLQSLASLELILEAEVVVLVELLQEVQQLGGRLHDGECRGLGVIGEDGDAAVGVEAKKPVLLLDVRADVDGRGGPFGAVGVSELLEHYLYLWW